MFTNYVLSWQHCFKNFNIQVIQNQLSNLFAHGVLKYATSRTLLLSQSECFGYPVVQIYKKEEWTLVIASTSARDPLDSQRLYCNYCQTHLISRLIPEFKDILGENLSVDGLIANRVAQKIPKKYLGCVGCFLPWDPKTQAGVNACKFIRDLAEHPKT